MNLSEDLKTIISTHGVEILSHPQVMNYFSDLGIAKNYPYAIPMLKEILSQHAVELVNAYKSNDKTVIKSLLNRCRVKYVNLYNPDRLQEVLDALAISLGIPVHNEEHVPITPLPNSSETPPQQISKFTQNSQQAQNNPPAASKNTGNAKKKAFNSFLWRLEQSIKSENEKCPIKLDALLTLSGITINQDYVVVDYRVSDMAKVARKEILIQRIYNRLRLTLDPNGNFHNNIEKETADAGKGFWLHFQDTGAINTLDLQISHSDLLNIMADPMTDQQLFDLRINSMNAVAPRKLDNITINEGVTFENGYFIDRNRITPYSSMKSINLNLLRQILAERINYPSSTFLKLYYMRMARAGLGLRYYYHSDNPTGLSKLFSSQPLSFTIDFNNGDMLQLTNYSTIYLPSFFEKPFW